MEGKSIQAIPPGENSPIAITFFVAMTLSITTFSITTFSIMTCSIMTLSITTLSIITFIIIVKVNVTLSVIAEHSYAECRLC